jgi:hypothetical protein
MGLDISHDAFSGAYSAFNRLRAEVCRAIGGSWPPHFKYGVDGRAILNGDGMPTTDESLDPESWYCDEEYTREAWPGLYEFLCHSDCDGEIEPDMCVKVADDLERIIPLVEALGSTAFGHIEAQGGYVEVLRKLVVGCRLAAEQNEPLLFY